MRPTGGLGPVALTRSSCGTAPSGAFRAVGRSTSPPDWASPSLLAAFISVSAPGRLGLGLAWIEKVRARPFNRRPKRQPCTYCDEIYSRRNSEKRARGIDTRIAIGFLITDDLIQDAAAWRQIKAVELRASMNAISEREVRLSRTFSGFEAIFTWLTAHRSVAAETP